MSNLSVSGYIYNATSYAIPEDYAYNYGSPVSIFDSSNISSTGNQNLAYKNGVSGDRYQFSEFSLLLFCQYTTSVGWKVIALPTIRFKLQTTNSICITQNYTGENRRVHLKYVDETTFNISLIQNTGRFIIYGIQ